MGPRIKDLYRKFPDFNKEVARTFQLELEGQSCLSITMEDIAPHVVRVCLPKGADGERTEQKVSQWSLEDLDRCDCEKSRYEVNPVNYFFCGAFRIKFTVIVKPNKKGSFHIVVFSAPPPLGVKGSETASRSLSNSNRT